MSQSTKPRTLNYDMSTCVLMPNGDVAIKPRRFRAVGGILLALIVLIPLGFLIGSMFDRPSSPPGDINVSQLFYVFCVAPVVCIGLIFAGIRAFAAPSLRYESNGQTFVVTSGIPAQEERFTLDQVVGYEVRPWLAFGSCVLTLSGGRKVTMISDTKDNVLTMMRQIEKTIPGLAALAKQATI